MRFAVPFGKLENGEKFFVNKKGYTKMEPCYYDGCKGTVNAISTSGKPAYFTDDFEATPLLSKSILSKKELDKILDFLVTFVFKNPYIVFDEDVRSCGYLELDLLSIIATLYNKLHLEVTGEEYEYFFHHVNKLGGYVNDNFKFTLPREEQV